MPINVEWMQYDVVVVGSGGAGSHAAHAAAEAGARVLICLLYTSPSPRDRYISRMPSSA